jgi:RNA polymerase sigma-70 factor (ECF subfamily)
MHLEKRTSYLKTVSSKPADEANFNRILEDYQERIFFLVQRMVIDPDDATDITQDVFIKVWQHRDSFKGDSSLYTWIYRIATNECLQFIRKKKRRGLLRLENYESTLAQKLQSDVYFNGDEYQRILHEAILTLPEKQRVVFQLKYFDELKYEQIAEITDTSVGALKASYHHAVKKIEEYAKEALNQ